APDLYQGHIAGTVEQAESLRYLEQDNVELLGEIVQAALRQLASRTGGNLGVIGFSMGANWALEAAAGNPKVKAVVLFYGTGGVDYGKIDAAVQGHFAENDPYEPPEGVRAAEEEMKASGLKVDFYNYAGASHWFAEDDRPEYDAGAARTAWERAIEFLRSKLKGRLVA
ncbi:MAG: dienelactone hydrolase family protein, partial [Bacteroidota bacterium]